MAPTSCPGTCSRPATSTTPSRGCRRCSARSSRARASPTSPRSSRRSATTQISFKDKGIESPADLEGKNVGSWGFGNEWELFAGMQDAGVGLKDISLVQQAFDMNAFPAGDIDAAQAMTYNEYARVPESVNPDTGELFQPEDLNVIDWNDVGTAMLQGRHLGLHRAS
ncbi:ABC transporter substrate-binding protein [Nocardioides sp. B-3]|uniref:ABC transporter substrate-binding protein n=1 Tax=Nocardioides sp. B-3 TaxID=2895565 RepID=UPI003FA53EE8